MDDSMRKPKYAAAFGKAEVAKNDRIMIYGDNVLVRLEGQETSLSFDRLRTHLQGAAGTSSGVLPSGVIHAETRGEIKIFVHQQAPRVVNVNWDARWCRDGRQMSHGKTFSYVKATLAMPYIISVISTYDDKLFYPFTLSRSAPLNGLESRCAAAPLLNVYDDARMCIGQGEISNVGKNDNPSANVVINFLRSLWNTSFNGDVCSSFSGWSAKVPQLGSIEKWEAATKANPNFILETGYPSSFTIEDIIRRIYDIAEGTKAGITKERNSLTTVGQLARIVERQGR